MLSYTQARELYQVAIAAEVQTAVEIGHQDARASHRHTLKQREHFSHAVESALDAGLSPAQIRLVARGAANALIARWRAPGSLPMGFTDAQAREAVRQVLRIIRDRTPVAN